MEEDVDGAQRPADLQPDAGQAAADEGQRDQGHDAIGIGAARRQRGEEQQPGAGAAADEIAGGAPVPVGLVPGGDAAGGDFHITHVASLMPDCLSPAAPSREEGDSQ
jgi:hypothetical protein